MNGASLRFFSRRPPGAWGHVPFLAPWWGEPKDDPDSLHLGQFAGWASAQDLPFGPTDDPSQADFFVLSISWKIVTSNPEAQAFADAEIAAAGKADRRIVIFFDSDHDTPIDWPAHAVVFRFSIYADTRHPCEYSIPTFSQDFLVQQRGGRLVPREKVDQPSVGFCGYAPPLGCGFSSGALRESCRYLLYRLGWLSNRRHLIAHTPRVQALRALRRTRGVRTAFLLRNQFAFNRWGVLQPGGTPQSATQQRREFIENLDTTDYALCARGLANCSIRFYEAVSLGRIPLFVNTRCVLPYDFVCDWRSVCVWVEETELCRIGDILRRRHAETASEEFVARQHRARERYERWIRPEGFFRELPRHWLPDWQSPA